MSVRVTLDQTDTWLEAPRDLSFRMAHALGAAEPDAELASVILRYWEDRFADDEPERMLP